MSNILSTLNSLKDIFYVLIPLTVDNLYFIPSFVDPGFKRLENSWSLDKLSL